MGLLCVRNIQGKAASGLVLTFLFYSQAAGAKRIPPKNYAENYLYRSDKLRIMKTK